MITADLADERAFAEIKRLCHTGLDPETLFRRVAEPLRRAVPFEGYAASTFDPLSGLPTGLVSNEEMGGKDDARFFVEHVYFEDDVNEYGWMARERIAVTRLSDGTGGRLERASGTGYTTPPKGSVTSCAPSWPRIGDPGEGCVWSGKGGTGTSTSAR